MIGFRIKYWRRQDKEDASVFYLSRSTRNEALIVGLMPDTYYWVRVMAYNGAGKCLISFVQFFLNLILMNNLILLKRRGTTE